jgi:hypothetical protein
MAEQRLAKGVGFRGGVIDIRSFFRGHRGQGPEKQITSCQIFLRWTLKEKKDKEKNTAVKQGTMSAQCLEKKSSSVRSVTSV